METYHGYVRTPADAIRLFEACRLGVLPRVQRRLSEKERQSIRSGSVFVWDEREAGMRRWTDGKSWSASRVSGSFLTYREMEGKRGGGFAATRRGAGKTPDSGRGSDEDQDDGEPEGYRYKADGLMKQSFSITTSTGQHLHLISYYSRPQPGQPELQQPTNDPALRGIVPVKGMYPESSMGETNTTPALTRAPMQQPPFMVAPQHHQQPYPVSYGQPGYGWPPSPVATPPYSHYVAPYPPNGHHQIPPHVTQATLPPPQYAQAPIYDQRTALPPPHSSKPAYQQHPSPHYTHCALPRGHESPREQHLQTAAQNVMVDARTNGPRTHQVPLPSLGAVTNGPPGSSLAAMSTPPSRALSVSPPRSSHSEAPLMSSSKTSLSALLHPTPAASEAGSAKPGSAGSSPRAAGACGLEKGGVSEDARALRMLDRKFCI
ncbi:hypothetical protein FZEAL_2361 [Fusarium zealandicum]|uniref:cAMP-independent regulatory protein pac2 n=1 Tax=Fusarium zealandicum TaxID=1053134 RepID=A0A8H4UQS0_9HYPO|nr:hypothetical protein FZEAL_2361 [Fusarium zealandicum]